MTAAPSDRGIQQVRIQPAMIDELAGILAVDRAQELLTSALQAGELLTGRIVWNINSTAHGGGVAEMLQTILAYGRGVGIDTRWLVLRGDQEFFTITKRLHNVLHGDGGDGGPLGEAEHGHFRSVMADNLASFGGLIRPGDIVLLHDPQTAGLVDELTAAGAIVVWRCHIGSDTSGATTERGWAFLWQYVRRAVAFVFSRGEYAPDWVPLDRLCVIAPSIDPFSMKNRELSLSEIDRILLRAGLVEGDDNPDPLPFTRRDGSIGQVRPHRNLFAEGAPLAGTDRLVVQVSRWDRLKDMTGVLAGFADASTQPDVHLMLAGPDVSGVSDDPEGAAVLDDCRTRWRLLPEGVRQRVHLVCLPMDDVDENAVMVNAIQRHASVVVQKSLVEGFGLTVTEALWKSRPMVASAVGGINDQIDDGRQGLLLSDPADSNAFGAALRRLLDDPTFAAALGAAGQQRVRDQYLPDRHLRQYFELFAGLLA